MTKVFIFSIAEIVDRYKKEQIVEGHVLSTAVVKVHILSVFSRYLNVALL